MYWRGFAWGTPIAQLRRRLKQAARIFWHHYSFLRRPQAGAYWVYVDGYYLLVSSASGRVLDVVIAH
jgi:Ni/Co efflux regulator RcnB